MYKIFFVEDEIVTREGIRDNVDWAAHGFELCGEATDGEMALQHLQSARPDLLLTDIKMPFMDGLQLSKIVREKMPWVKVVILSGHDEFEYAQEAIKLGVTEYLLKPVTVQDMHAVLDKIGAQLDREHAEQENLRKLHEQIEENQAALRERFLLKLVVGAVSSTDAIEKSQQLGLDLIARYYLVVIIKAELIDRSEQFDYEEYQKVLGILSSLVENNPDVFLLNKDWDEFVLLMKGNTAEYLEEERDTILARLSEEVNKTGYQLIIGSGAPKNRTALIYKSFVEALINIQEIVIKNKTELNIDFDKAELIKVDRTAIEDYLRCGVKEGFDDFFNTFMRPLGESAVRSYLIKTYIFVDVVLATAKFINELGGEIDRTVSEINSIESLLMNIKTIDQLRDQVYTILVGALVFRDNLSIRQYAVITRQAKEYIEKNFTNPDLSLSEVAAQVNLSPSYFSVVFSQEIDQTFKEYLTEVRIKKAKELLRTTNLRSAEIPSQIGYSDPHYFSYVFKKKTGLSPTEFRQQAQTE